MRLKRLEIIGFKSFARKSTLVFNTAISAVVGPNGSGKSNVAEALRFVLGEQSIRSMRGKKSEDLIFNGSERVGRMGRAKVVAVFDNTDRALNIDFDEVAIGREVLRDNTHIYTINGNKVRLKDVVEVLSSLHIGASGHHIISQGEADRILLATSRERKLIVEDALGLKIYHWKISESEAKLQKTEANLKEIDIQRRELEPQLRHLKRQMERVERARQLRSMLTEQYLEYLRREALYLDYARRDIAEKEYRLAEQRDKLEQVIAEKEQRLSSDAVGRSGEETIRSLQEDLREVRRKKSEILRAIGRVEGSLEYAAADGTRAESDGRADTVVSVPYERIGALINDIDNQLSRAQREHRLEAVRHAIGEVRRRLSAYLEELRTTCRRDNVPADHTPSSDSGKVRELRSEKERLEEEYRRVLEHEREYEERLRESAALLDKHRGQLRAAEREVLSLKARMREVAVHKHELERRRHELLRRCEAFASEVEDARNCIGTVADEYEQLSIPMEEIVQEDRSMQERRRREIERTKARLEDIDIDDAGRIEREYREVSEQVAYLQRHIRDLTESAAHLRLVISDLSERLAHEFTAGVERINTQFQEYFAVMFGGGSARLATVRIPLKRRVGDGERESDTSEEIGLDINVTMPRKKISGLAMLSGGERALTSIALLFAISQVKPPPFMVLDETDAALDEANSRRYGDMLEKLSAYSQLVVITHNRETMRRAGVLYGVTMGRDAVSELLSVQFEDAVRTAK